MSDIGANRRITDVHVAELSGEIKTLNVKVDGLKEGTERGFVHVEHLITDQGKTTELRMTSFMEDVRQQMGFMSDAIRSVSDEQKRQGDVRKDLTGIVDEQKRQGDVRLDVTRLENTVRWISRTSVAAMITGVTSIVTVLLLHALTNQVYP
jgi:hypothetical protein